MVYSKRFWTLLLLVLLSLHGTISAHDSSPKNDKPTLHFRSDGTFKIVQFTDLHYGGGGENYTVLNQVQILEKEKPDFVAVSGDVLTNGQKEVETLANWFLAINPINSRNIPYAVAFGCIFVWKNHDDGMGKSPVTRRDLVKVDEKYSHSLTQGGPTDINGTTNYYLRVYDSKNKTALILWFFDSNDVGCMQEPTGWGCIEPDQLKWYSDLSAVLTKENGGVPYPSLAFFHIPLVEQNTIYQYCGTRGLNLDGVSSAKVNSGAAEAMLKAGDIRATFCGHNHKDDFYGIYKGKIRMYFGRKSGWGYYNPPAWMLHGSRVIEVSLKGDDIAINTWLRLADGSQILEDEQIAVMPSEGYKAEYCGGVWP